MSTQNIKPVGLKLPLQRGSNGFFNQNFTTIDQAYTNIKNLLMTIFGERRLNTDFGSQLNRIIFEQINDEDELSNRIETQIKNLIDVYFPYVNINRIDVVFPNYNPHQINISIEFELKNSSNIKFGDTDTKLLEFSFNTSL